jgi:predicted transcriptional regulator
MLPEISEIKNWRKRLGLTQQALAKAVGVTQSAIAKLEGGGSPSYALMKKIVEFLQGVEKGMELKAKQIMSHKVISIHPNTRVTEAIKIMRAHKISQLPVVEANRVLGSISEKTVLDRIAQGEDPARISSTRVSQILEEPFPQIDENAPISVMSPLLLYAQAVLVVRKERVAGIITKADLLKAVRK